MSKNIIKQRIYVSKVLFAPIIVVLLVIATSFGLELLEIISTEVYEGRYGSVSLLNEDPWGYWGGVFKYSSLTVAPIYLSIIVRIKKT